MFELPEFITLARQINEAIEGKVILRGCLGNAPHKFVWYNRSRDEFTQLTAGKTIGQTKSKGKWLFIPVEPGYVLTLGECGGKVLYHSAGAQPPAKYHLCLTFTDGAFFTVTTQMWGAIDLYQRTHGLERPSMKGMRPTPTEPEFTFTHLNDLINTMTEKQSVTCLLTHDQLIPGIGHALAQDILFHAQLRPRYPAHKLDIHQRHALYNAIMSTVWAAIEQGGRYDEVDLYNRPGGYVRVMDNHAMERPCPLCRGKISRIHYMGSACYFCPRCQSEGKL